MSQTFQKTVSFFLKERFFNDHDCVSIQDDLTGLHAWCTKWKLNLNLHKCSIMSVSLKRNLLLLIITDQNKVKI